MIWRNYLQALDKVLPSIRIKSKQPDEVILVLGVDENIDYFKGHFPGTPILAGVVQLDWAVKFGIEYLGLQNVAVKSLDVLKFQVIIEPNQDVELTLIKKSDTKFTFKYVSAKGTHASGRVVLEES